MKVIPLHTLVIIVRPQGSNLPLDFCRQINDYEYLNLEDTRYSLVGEKNRTEINKIALNEIVKTVHNKLELGERVIVDTGNVKKEHREYLARIGTKHGVPVFYVVYNENLSAKQARNLESNETIEKDEEIFSKNEKSILMGDHLAEVIDLRLNDMKFVEKVRDYDTLHSILERKNRFKGVTVIGDVHGTLESMKNAVAWARSRHHFIVFLGDLVDYGPRPIECVDLAYDVVMRGEGTLILGNHERKISRYLHQLRKGDVRVKLSSGNRVTTDILDQLSSDSRNHWISRFHALVAHGRNHLVGGKCLFTHGAAHLDMWHDHGRRLPYKSDAENRAYFGEVDKNNPNKSGYPNRVYNWVDEVPKGNAVFVGHDIRRLHTPLTVEGSKEGTVYFLDTGAGKGGTLSTADLKLEYEDENPVFRVTNFNKY